LPDKQTVNRFTPEFVEENDGIGLEIFIRRVVIHPELWDAVCLGTFLRADDYQFTHVKNVGKAMDMAEMTGGVGVGGIGDYGRSDSIGNSSNNMIGIVAGVGGTGTSSSSLGTGTSSSSLGGAGAFNLAPKNAAGIKNGSVKPKLPSRVI
jgi:hypothetical protein